MKIIMLMSITIFSLLNTNLSYAKKKSVTLLSNSDFVYGTYIIDKPGVYRLVEDINFNPNSVETLTTAVNTGLIPPDVAAQLDLLPIDAYKAGYPLRTQYSFNDAESFTPGGPLDARYEPAGFGLGFFAAIVISAKNVVLDLNGHTIRQSEEHALLQRFFSIIELAEQPFVPNQGPADFGQEIKSAKNVTIKNGVIGLSAHHGIHGNGNKNIVIKNVDFENYEVSAVALNGVKGLMVKNSIASSRKDVPILGTFSAAQFIKLYIDYLYSVDSSTTLSINGVDLTVADIRGALRTMINNTYNDIIETPNIIDGRAQINALNHPDEYGLFHNYLGIIDGNSYSFLINPFGVAVNGFPTKASIDPENISKNIWFKNVDVYNQTAFINEVITLKQNGNAVIDPAGAVFQIYNLHPETGEPLTMSSLDKSTAKYTGNPVANAQAFVAKAFLNGEFSSSPLDLTRSNITADVLKWVEAAPGYETLDSLVASPSDYFCNGDSMFHVNKGVIGYKIDGAKNVFMKNTTVTELHNYGLVGSSTCGNYLESTSHPLATLLGYGGAKTRGYSFSGSENILLANSQADYISAKDGSAIGIDVLTDTANLFIQNMSITNVKAGDPETTYQSPNQSPKAIGVQIGADTHNITLRKTCAELLDGYDGEEMILDYSDSAELKKICGEH